MRQGLIIYPAGGTADGRNGAHILIAPPYVYSDDHADELLTKLIKTLDVIFF